MAYLIVGQDITLTKRLELEIREHQAAEERIRQSGEQFRFMFYKHPAVMYLVDIQTMQIYDANEAAQEFYGYSADTIKNMKITDFSGRRESELLADIQHVIRCNNGIFSSRHRLADGTQRDVEIHATTVPFYNKQVIFSIVHDVTERKKAEAYIAFLAYHDSLTGLPNRKYFDQRMEQELERAQRKGERLGVLFLDIDGFKNINDIFGHQAGDNLLREISGKIKGTLRDSDFMARVGGDEFTMLIFDIQDQADLDKVVEKIRDASKLTVVEHGKSFSVEASIGYSIFPDDGGSGTELIRKADQAMYLIKHLQKHRGFLG
jgi:diguanylate cyclase (GGDEF)-like protein/PAS domain S-box-containing protein